MNGKELVGQVTCVLGCSVLHVFITARREFMQDALKDPVEAFEEYTRSSTVPVYVQLYCDRVIQYERQDRINDHDTQLEIARQGALWDDGSVWYGN